MMFVKHLHNSFLKLFGKNNGTINNQSVLMVNFDVHCNYEKRFGRRIGTFLVEIKFFFFSFYRFFVIMK